MVPRTTIIRQKKAIYNYKSAQCDFAESFHGESCCLSFIVGSKQTRVADQLSRGWTIVKSTHISKFFGQLGIFLVFFFSIRQVEGDPLHGDAADVALWPSARSWSLLQSYSLADYLPGSCFCFVVRRIIHTTLHIGRPSPRSLITCVHFHSITII